MESVYLVSSFISGLQSIFNTIFSDILAPILTDILKVFTEYFLSVIWSMWSEWLLAILSFLCALVDFLEGIFNVFAGISPVEARGEQTYLLDAFFQMEEVTLAFACITVMAVAICFIFTIYKTAKSISDMALDNKNPISKVLADGMKASITFMLIPFLCIFMLQTASVVTTQAISAFDAAQGGGTSIGTIIFLSAGLDADKATASRRDIFTGEVAENQSGRNPAFNDDVRLPYLNGTKDYRDLLTVKRDFYPSNFNFFVGFASALLMLFVLAGASMIFIRRLFELLLLYITSPFFVSTIPLDDGAVFAKWRELFVAKFFSGFGVIFSMRYYLMLVPSIAGSRLCLYSMELPDAVMINNVLKLFLIIGGGWAVYKSQHLILQIFNQEAALADQQAGALISGIAVGTAMTAANAAMAASTGGASAAMSGMSGIGGGLGGLKNIASAAGDIAGSAGGGDDRQRFKG